MTTMDEAAGGFGQQAASNQAGIDSISEFQRIRFTKYRRVILPADGFAFWVRESILTPSALYDASAINAFFYNAPQRTVISGTDTEAQKKAAELAETMVVDVSGSLHYATNVSQEEDKTYATNRVVFTSQRPVNELNVVNPDVLYLAEFDGVRFAFAARGKFYRQAGLWHYEGSAVYSDLETQIIDDKRQLDTRQLVVSNSLPIWLSLNAWSSLGQTPTLVPWMTVSSFSTVLYPSYLVPMNLPPPYAAVHILPDDTETLSISALTDATSSQSQLMRDKVRITLLGSGNDVAQDFVEFVQQYMTNFPDDMGLMNSPVLRDEKRGQVELQALAQKKTVVFEISYLQSRARAISQQLLEQALATYFVEPSIEATILPTNNV